MKKIFLSLLIITILVSCSKEPEPVVTPPATTDLKISFNNTVNGVTISNPDSSYTNAANNVYTISLLKYYVTNISLVDENNNEWFAKNYNLIDINEPSQNIFTLKNIPKGKYTKMKFILGVDSIRNTSGVQDGYLDPSYGMIWTWNTGYIFFKHEGTYKNSSSIFKPLRLHLGTNEARGYIEMALPKINIDGTISKMTIDFDLNKVYSDKSTIDFNIDNDRQSSNAEDVFWIVNMKNNLENSFKFGKAE